MADKHRDQDFLGTNLSEVETIYSQYRDSKIPVGILSPREVEIIISFSFSANSAPFYHKFNYFKTISLQTILTSLVLQTNWCPGNLGRWARWPFFKSVYRTQE